MDDQLLDDRMPLCVINPQAPWKTTWNVSMLLIVIFISITVPYRIAFEDVTPQEWLICDIVLDTLFLIDICLNFFTATENESGELVTDLKLIAM
jgi:hypothetical protein